MLTLLPNYRLFTELWSFLLNCRIFFIPTYIHPRSRDITMYTNFTLIRISNLREQIFDNCPDKFFQFASANSLDIACGCWRRLYCEGCWRRLYCGYRRLWRTHCATTRWTSIWRPSCEWTCHAWIAAYSICADRTLVAYVSFAEISWNCC